ncbi:hypothetical protein [Fodinicola acaciae]|uniref:hypothetical protein n=1 Tax=Fodinicola acaciae TaxID=2681555 RepID=UPI0013D5E7C2|nr:hypothetical protein [Fodinicola acaciae]
MSRLALRNGVVAVLSAATLAVAGCTGSGGGQPPTATSSTSASPGLSQDQLLAKIPLNGSARVPISWRLARQDDPVVQAARRFLSLNEVLASSTDVKPLVPLIDAVSTGTARQVAHSVWDSAKPSGRLALGPLWIWLDTPVRQATGTVVVPVCRDIGWWDSDGKPAAPRHGDRASVESLTLVGERTDDGPPRWKVTTYAPKADKAVTSAFAASCQAWSNHKP